MKTVKNETINQVNVFHLWKQAEAHAGRDISFGEVVAKSGVYNSLVKHMYENKPVKADKVVKVVKVLYEISGLTKPTELLHIQTMTVGTWLDFEEVQ